VKVVRGEEVTSLFYPPPNTYTFHYSLSSSAGDWKAAKVWRTGMNWTNALLPISVVDRLSTKTLPPTNSFCSLKQDGLVISALKKAETGPAVMLRVYEIEGSTAQTPVEFLGRAAQFDEVNLLEEDLQREPPQTILRAGPHAIKTLKINVESRSR
jgi:alpha-mannosidase